LSDSGSPAYTLRQIAAPPMDSETETQIVRPRLALLVDDSPTIRIVMQHLLGQYGFECDQAATGSAAIQQFVEQLKEPEPYELVCLDVGLPDVDGMSVLTQIRRLEKEAVGRRTVHIVVLTADDSEQTVRSMLSDGADAYYLKPFDRAALGGYLDKLFGPPQVR